MSRYSNISNLNQVTAWVKTHGTIHTVEFLIHDPRYKIFPLKFVPTADDPGPPRMTERCVQINASDIKGSEPGHYVISEDCIIAVVKDHIFERAQIRDNRKVNGIVTIATSAGLTKLSARFNLVHLQLTTGRYDEIQVTELSLEPFQENSSLQL